MSVINLILSIVAAVNAKLMTAKLQLFLHFTAHHFEPVSVVFFSLLDLVLNFSKSRSGIKWYIWKKLTLSKIPSQLICTPWQWRKENEACAAVPQRRPQRGSLRSGESRWALVWVRCVVRRHKPKSLCRQFDPLYTVKSAALHEFQVNC